MNNKYVVKIFFLVSLLFIVGCTTQSNSFLEFNECLAENGVVIYGSEWCPACQSLVELLGGNQAIQPIYVECTNNQQRCTEETRTNYIPEIQINGEIYEGARTIQELASITGCEVIN